MKLQWQPGQLNRMCQRPSFVSGRKRNELKLLIPVFWCIGALVYARRLTITISIQVLSLGLIFFERWRIVHNGYLIFFWVFCLGTIENILSRCFIFRWERGIIFLEVFSWKTAVGRLICFAGLCKVVCRKTLHTWHSFCWNTCLFVMLVTWTVCAENDFV